MHNQELNPRSRSIKLQLGAMLFLLAVLVAGCRTAPPLPPADFSAPGWSVQQGQAVWKPNSRRPELAGELLVATNTTGSTFVQFTKDPFPLATTQTTAESWQISFAAGQRSWRGRGRPPNLFMWFQLPAALRAEALPRPWKFTRAADSWRLGDPHGGEWLEGRFFQ